MQNGRRFSTGLVFAAACMVVAIFQTPAIAQTAPAKIRSTRVEVHLVTTQLQNALKSQEWGRAFQKIGYAIRIRRAEVNDRPEVTERVLAGYRTVTAVGILDRTGTIEFRGNQKFKTTDTAKLKKWLDSLQKYGAQGAPDGKPMWGLNSEQFASVYNSMSHELRDEIYEFDILTAIAALDPPQEHPVIFSPQANSWLNKQSPRPVVRQKLKGISKATALAIMLKDHGLGYYPIRTPAATIELQVKPLIGTEEKPWPVGWELRLPRTKTAPLMFKLFPVNLKEMAIVDLAQVVAEKTNVPILFDYHTIATAKIDLDELTITIPERKSTLFRAIQTATSRNRLSQKLVIDELGKPLIYVTTSAAAREKALKGPVSPAK